MPSFTAKAEGLDFIFAKEDEGAKAPAVNIIAYNGGMLRLGNFRYPVVLDIEGIKAGPRVPILVDHTNSPEYVLGQGEITKGGGMVTISGQVTGVSAMAQTVLESARNGHVYQASVGAIPLKSKVIAEGVTEKVNGQTFTGPVIVVTQSEIVEVSVVAIGADRNGTEVEIAAMFGLDLDNSPELGNVNAKERKDMDPKFVEWVSAQLGLTVDNLDESQITALQASYSRQTGKAGEPKDDGKVAELQAELAEVKRVSAIQAACSGEFAELESKAIEAGWTAEQTESSIEEIRKVREARPAAPGVIVNAGLDKNGSSILEASVCLRHNIDEKTVEAAYGAETLDRADKLRGMGLKELMHASCKVDGVPVPGYGASPQEMANAAFSTRTFPTILSNVANKSMMQSYNAQESVAVQVSKALTASDFKTHTGVRLAAGGGMEKVENGGEVKHGTLEDESYTYAVDTYGELLGITRQDIINDDLGAFMAIPQQIGFDAWQLRENLFFTLMLANTGTFYSTVNGNYFDGADSVLGIDSVNDARTLLEKQTDAKGRAIALQPEILLVPSELSQTAEGLYTSERLITGEDATRTAANTVRGKYRPLSTPFLSNTGITGYSSTAWYMFANPMVNAAFGIAYLQGRQAPIIEEVAMDGRYLGRTWRGIYDLGVCQIDKRPSVKSKGAA